MSKIVKNIFYSGSYTTYNCQFKKKITYTWTKFNVAIVHSFEFKSMCTFNIEAMIVLCQRSVTLVIKVRITLMQAWTSGKRGSLAPTWADIALQAEVVELLAQRNEPASQSANRPTRLGWFMNPERRTRIGMLFNRWTPASRFSARDHCVWD